MNVEIFESVDRAWSVGPYHGKADLNIKTTISGTTITMRIWSAQDDWEDEFHMIVCATRADALEMADKTLLKFIHAQYRYLDGE